MPSCRDPQHEKFAREYVEQWLKVPAVAQPELEAYKAAGFKPHRGNCYRLKRRPDVKRRIDELMAEAAEWLDIRPRVALVRIDRIAAAVLPQYYERVEVNGQPRYRLRDLTALPPRLAEAIADVEFDEHGRPTRLRLHDKLGANTLLLRHFGGLPAEAPSTEVSIFNVLSAEDQRALADALDALERGAPALIEGAASAGRREPEDA